MTAGSSSDPKDKLLAGYTVLDFTRVLAGPYCTRLLADLGARVIKVERPGEGDEIRYTMSQLEEGRVDQSSYFVRINAGKQGIAINLAHPDARELILDLLNKADVLVENFSPGVMARFGLDAESLRAIKPELIYCSISGFGQTGPNKSDRAYAHLINAISGMMDLDRSGEAEPRVQYLQAADVLAATHAFGAISAALLRQARTGQGATLDVSMFESLIASDDTTYGALINGGPVERRARPGMVVHRVGDRHIALQSAGSSHLWNRLTETMEKPALKEDPRFVTPMARRVHWSELLDEIYGWLDTFDCVEDPLNRLLDAGVPATPMLTPEEAIEHPQLLAREAFPEIEHPGRGPIKVTASPFHVDGQATHPQGPAPHRIGEQTHDVLSELLGYSEQKIKTLQNAGVVDGPD